MNSQAYLQYFKAVFDEYYGPLCNYAASIIGDPHVAEDVVQQLFVQLWYKQALESVENPQAYLLRSTKFKCIDFLRSTRQEVVSLEAIPEPNVEDEGFREEDIIPMLHFFAASLPPKTRQVFLLSRVEGYSNQEIADELNLSVKTVENQMTRALKKLRELLKQHEYLSLLLWLISR